MSKYRFNLELTEDSKAQLEDLQQRSNAASFTEVIRRSLAVYDALNEYASDDWEIVLRHKKRGTEKSIILV